MSGANAPMSELPYSFDLHRKNVNKTWESLAEIFYWLTLFLEISVITKTHKRIHFNCLPSVLKSSARRSDHGKFYKITVK